MKIAGAPVSWGVCEVPGWGPVRAVLNDHGVELVGGFVPLVLHRAAARIVALSVDEQSHLVAMLAEVDRIVADRGITQVLHPHVNTARDVQFVFDNSDAGRCLDTGHLAIGGFDPIEFAREDGVRVAHVHLKDVDLGLAARLWSGERSLMEAIVAGVFRSLGIGHVDVAAVIRSLLGGGYDGWFVLEQDFSIQGDAPTEGTGPVEDVAIRLEFLRAQIDSFETVR